MLMRRKNADAWDAGGIVAHLRKYIYIFFKYAEMY